MENTINKFIEFSLKADNKLFIEIFGEQRGNQLYHNHYFALCGKNMPKFIDGLNEPDKKQFFNYLNGTIYSEQIV